MKTEGTKQWLQTIVTFTTYSSENHVSTSNDKWLRNFDRGVKMSSNFQKTCKNKFGSLKICGGQQAHLNFSQ